jgi:hypothetical protein
VKIDLAGERAIVVAAVEAATVSKTMAAWRQRARISQPWLSICRPGLVRL